jgi:glycosyltransferase involved in cell wall biosynthesis
MRIVIDMQGLQAVSPLRGIGTVARELTKALIKNKKKHEIILALNGALDDTIESLKDEFRELLPDNIRVWYAPLPLNGLELSNYTRISVAEKIREAFLSSLSPDVILILSFFDDPASDLTVSIGAFDNSIPVAVLIHDFIPLVNPYKLQLDVRFRKFYFRRLEYLKKSAIFLTNSEYVKEELSQILSVNKGRIHNVSLACGEKYTKTGISPQRLKKIYADARITRSFVLFVSASDERENHLRLIEAYSNLSNSLRASYQLVFAAAMPQEDIEEFYRVGKNCGLTKDELIVTGYLDESAIIALYSHCSLFVFLSLSEGFELPPLEAMACGAPVIASNTASLPEVIGHEGMLFNPYSADAIRDKIEEVLTNKTFQQEISVYGRERVKKFSWDNSAKKTSAALENLQSKKAERFSDKITAEVFSPRPLSLKKILLISFHNLENFVFLLPALTKLKKFYPLASIDILTDKEGVFFAENLSYFNKVYALESEELPNKHIIYDIAVDLQAQKSTRAFLVAANAFLKIGYETNISKIDECLDIKLQLYNESDLTEQSLRLIDAIPVNMTEPLKLSESKDNKHKKDQIAIFVSAQNRSFVNYPQLLRLLLGSDMVTGINLYLDEDLNTPKDKKLNKFINLGYEEIFYSLKESSLCLTDNMFGAYASAHLNIFTITLNLDGKILSRLSDYFSGHFYQISKIGYSSSGAYTDTIFDCIERALASTDKYPGTVPQMPAIAPKFKNNDEIINALIISIAETHPVLPDELKFDIARCIETSVFIENRKKQLLLDISELVKRDVKTGIQRVVRNILYHFLISPPKDYEVMPIYFSAGENSYLYAKRFTKRFMGEPDGKDYDLPIHTQTGDIYFGLDLHYEGFDRVREMHKKGIKQVFLVYDLIPVTSPRYFPGGHYDTFSRWLALVADGDMAICISKATATDLLIWIQDCAPHRLNSISVPYSYNGAGEDKPVMTSPLTKAEQKIISKLTRVPTFLMVGTLEARKGHWQVLTAFEKLWERGLNVNLVIIGKKGWLVENLAERLDNHRELDNRLFWLKGLSDAYLETVYKASVCLIAASKVEGFGLPLIEAAQHKLPIIARDIPVFREVAGKFAYYFSGVTPEALADDIVKWLKLHKADKHPKSDNMPYMTWKESTENLKNLLTKNLFNHKLT